ncbi:ribosome small subunit-dependent GTPase A [Acidomonas methanolica]|uniref:ribosome small subunit-dependent GTPase A n=2 Tax=Acidomonas methanolica TaxID=437 RepID=UPI0009DF20A6|nr:ribosome small subunit-dependent GTPase A [Acidomonas methanolica]
MFAAQQFSGSSMLLGRVVSQQRHLLTVITNAGPLQADIAGRLLHVSDVQERPVIGDWVMCLPRQDERRATIHSVLPRSTCFVRKEVGQRTRPQVIAANIDVAFLVMTMGADFNLSRLERYLALTKESGAMPVIILTKADICEDTEAFIRATRTCAPTVNLQIVSALEGIGLQQTGSYLSGHKTGVMVGSSGAGKSTLLNALLKTEHAVTGAVSAFTEKGRHTTTSRELVRLPLGGLLIDTPGMRELGMICNDAGVEGAFGDFSSEIKKIAQHCRFRNCQHQSEPDCAVHAARAEGIIDDRRWNNWIKLKREVSYLMEKENPEMKRAKRREQIRLNRQSRSSGRNN